MKNAIESHKGLCGYLRFTARKLQNESNYLKNLVSSKLPMRRKSKNEKKRKTERKAREIGLKRRRFDITTMNLLDGPQAREILSQRTGDCK